MSEENVDIVRRAIEAFNRDGIEATLEFFDPDVEWETPDEWPEARSYKGHEAVRRFADTWIETFDEYRWDVERYIDAGEKVVVLLHQRSRGKGGAVEIEQPLGVVYEIREGKIGRVRAYFAWAEALEAMGLHE